MYTCSNIWYSPGHLPNACQIIISPGHRQLRPGHVGCWTQGAHAARHWQTRQNNGAIFQACGLFWSFLQFVFQLTIGSGLTVTAVSSGSIPKFGIYGTSVTHAGLMMAQAQEEQILLGPTTRSLLPSMFKVKDYKEIAGVGLTHQLLVKSEFLAMNNIL